MPNNKIIDILNIVREQIGYENRIPEINKDNLHNLSQLPPEDLNKWIDVLVKIVKSYAYSYIFNRSKNPFSEFYREKLESGFSIEDLYIQLITGKIPAWDDNGSYALSKESPEVLSYYHKINYEMQYKVSTSYAQARTAFLTVSGVESFLNRILSQLSTACELDLYYNNLELLSTMFMNRAYYTENISGFSSEDNYNEFMLSLQNIIDDMKLPSNKFNSAGVLTSSDDDGIVIIATPKVINTINVMLLSGKYQLDKIDFKNRIIKVPTDYGFGTLLDASGVLAIVVDKNVFRIFPALYEASSIFNPASLVLNTFLTTEFIFSFAKFENAAIILDGSKTYTPTASATNGTITLSPNGAQKAGTEITATITPSEGYAFVPGSLIISADEGKTTFKLDDVPATGGTSNFIMPAKDISVTCTFTNSNTISAKSIKRSTVSGTK